MRVTMLLFLLLFLSLAPLAITLTTSKCSLLPPALEDDSREVIKRRYSESESIKRRGLQPSLEEKPYGEITILVKEEGFINYSLNGVFPTGRIFPEYIFGVQDKLRIFVNGSGSSGIILASIALSITFKSRKYAEMMYSIIRESPEVINLYTMYLGFSDAVVSDLAIEDRMLIAKCFGESYLRENVTSLKIFLEITRESLLIKESYEGYLLCEKEGKRVLSINLRNEVFNLTSRYGDRIFVKVILPSKSYITSIEPAPTSTERYEKQLTCLWSYAPLEITVTFVIDLRAPEIVKVSQSPTTVSFLDTVTVFARVVDKESGISTVYLFYTSDYGRTWKKISMKRTDSDTYEAKIPPHPLGTRVIYYIEARDNVSNVSTSSQFEYTVTVPLGITLLVLIALLLALLLAYRFWRGKKK